MCAVEAHMTGHANSGVTTMLWGLSQYGPAEAHCKSAIVTRMLTSVALLLQATLELLHARRQGKSRVMPANHNKQPNTYETFWASDHSIDMVLTTGLLWTCYRCWLQCCAAHHGTLHSLPDPPQCSEGLCHLRPAAPLCCCPFTVKEGRIVM